jgi:hypothetical protein
MLFSGVSANERVGQDVHCTSAEASAFTDDIATGTSRRGTAATVPPITTRHCKQGGRIDA